MFRTRKNKPPSEHDRPSRGLSLVAVAVVVFAAGRIGAALKVPEPVTPALVTMPIDEIEKLDQATLEQLMAELTPREKRELLERWAQHGMPANAKTWTSTETRP